MASTLFDEDVVQRTHRSKLQFGLVVINYDDYSSVDESEEEEKRIRKGYVRVAWYPKGRETVLPEKKVMLYDRSLMPGDAVRRNLEGSQRGIVRSVNVSCHLQAIRTKQMIYNVCSRNLDDIMMYGPSSHVVMGSWIGVVRNVVVQVVVRLKNGARCTLPEDSACRLTDIHDNDEEASVFTCDSFYPGQVLRGPAMTFKNATWLSGQQPILTSKANFTVTVEEVSVIELDVHWQTRGLCRCPGGDCTDDNQLQPPPRKVTKDMLPGVKPMTYFNAASIQIGDKVIYRVRPGDLAYSLPVTRGSLDCFVQPPKGDASCESSALRETECKLVDPEEDESHLANSACQLDSALKDQQEIPDTRAVKVNSCEEHQESANQTESESPQNRAEHNEVLADELKPVSAEDLCKSGVDCSQDRSSESITQKAETSEDLAREASGIEAGTPIEACAENAEVPQQASVDEGSSLQACSGVQNSQPKVEEAKRNFVEAVGHHKSELLAKAELLRAGLSRDMDLLEELYRQLCDTSQSVTDIANNFRGLLQRASSESAREISEQVSRLLESQGKLQQQILMTEGLLVDSKKSLKDLDSIEMETRGAPSGKPAPGKAFLKNRRQQAANNRNRRKLEEDTGNSSSSNEENSSTSEDSDDSDETDSNASSKGDGRKHRVVSCLLRRHAKKQVMRLAPKRRPPPKPLEVDELVCVEVTHTRTLVDVMWQDGTLEKEVMSTDLVPVHQLDDLEFFPGDFVTKNNEDLENVYGLVCRTDHKDRTCLIQWIVRPNQQCNIPKPINTEEVSVYELMPHPDFTFNVGDVIVRIADSQHGIASLKKGKTTPRGGSFNTQMGDPGTPLGNRIPICASPIETSTQVIEPTCSTPSGDPSAHYSQPSTHSGEPSTPWALDLDSSDPSTRTEELITNSGKACAHSGECGTHSSTPSTYADKSSTHFGEPSTHCGETGIHSGETGIHSGETGTHSGETGTHSGETGTHSGETGIHSDEPGTHSGKPGTHSGEPGTHSGEPGTHSGKPSTHSDAPNSAVDETKSRLKKPSTLLTNHTDYLENSVRISTHLPRNQLSNPGVQTVSPSDAEKLNGESHSTNNQSTAYFPSMEPAVKERQPINVGKGSETESGECAGTKMDDVEQMNQTNLKMDSVVGAEGNPAVRPDVKDQGIPCAGQVRWINTNGEIHVAWVDGSECTVLPQDLYKLEEDSDSDWSDNEQDNGEWRAIDQMEGSSDSTSSSWETASDASASNEEANISSPPPNEKKSKPSPSSPVDHDAPSSARGVHTQSSPQSANESLQDSFSALSLVEDKMRQINSFASSILEKRNALALLSPDKESRKSFGAAASIAEAASDQEQGATHSRSIQATREAPSKESSTQTAISEQARTSLEEPDHNLEEEGRKKAASSPGTSPTEAVAAETEESTSLADKAGHKDGIRGNGEPCSDLPAQGATATASGQACGNFFLMEDVPETQHFNKPGMVFSPDDPKQFSLTMRREMRLLQTSLPQGIRVKGFADRMDLFSVLLEGPANTPYEDGLFFFDALLPSDYPKSPPIMHYHAYCSGRLNPNLYNDGKVCVSLLGTWTGKGSEMWTSKSNLLQVLVSIQGLILVSEPYYNEAGYEKHRGSQPGKENSRLYNETAVLKLVQSMTLMLTNPPDVFHDETIDFCRRHSYRLIKRVEHWLSIATTSPTGWEPGAANQEVTSLPAFTLFPLSKGFVLSMRQALRAYRAALCVAGIPDS